MVGNGIAHAQPGVPFKVLVANFGNGPITLLKGQKVAMADSHPTGVVESDVMLAEMLGMTNESDVPRDGKKTYQKRQVDVKDTEIINKHLADLRESHMEKDDDPTTADDIPLDEVPDELKDRVRQMVRRQEHMWLGKLGQINVTEHGIDLKPGSKPFKSPPHRSFIFEK